MAAEPPAKLLLIVTGSTLRAEDVDRPLAYYLKQRIDRWNRRPKLIMLAGAALGLPPLYLLGFIARPVLNMQLATFTGITLAGRVARYTTMVAVARLL